MPEPNSNNTRSFAKPKDLEQWLLKNHAVEQELWVKIFKKKSGIESVDWDDVVIASLCWGWIDGIKKSLDDQAYLQRITPRRPKSVWSKRNTDHVANLISAGLMQEVGLVHVHAAKQDGRWDQAYASSEMEVPQDFVAALDHIPSAKAFYEGLTKSSRRAIAYGLESAKKPETRHKRFTKYMDMMAQKVNPTTGRRQAAKA